MSLKKALLLKLLGLSLGAIISVSAYAVDTAVEASSDAVVPKESMFQAGRSYIARVSDRLADTVTGKSEELINRAMEVIGVRYRWDTELPQSGLDGSSFVGYFQRFWIKLQVTPSVPPRISAVRAPAVVPFFQ